MEDLITWVRQPVQLCKAGSVWALLRCAEIQPVSRRVSDCMLFGDCWLLHSCRQKVLQLSQEIPPPFAVVPDQLG